MYPELSESERFPLLTPRGRKLLHAMRQHPHAPLWNWPNGEQLDAQGLARVEQFAVELSQPRTAQPDWLDAFADYCLQHVPFYRGRNRANQDSSQGGFQSKLSASLFQQQPSCSRDDLAPRVWDFVPDDQPLDELIVFSTSGTTGHPTKLLFTPSVAACGVPLLEHALARHGISFPRGPEQVALLNVAAYREAFTTAIVVAWLQEAGCVRVNLHPSAWRHAGDCEAYINHWHAPIWLGDPVALEQVLTLKIKSPPQAIISSIMRLPEALARQLSERFDCPVLDIIAMTEVGLLALKSGESHEVLPHDVYVEILGDDDCPLPDGQTGEVTVTSRRNPLMPLLRYRTGDFAALERQGTRTLLKHYQGRIPVRFQLESGRQVHCMEVTRLMRQYPLMQYRLHQAALDHFQFGYRGHVDLDALRRALAELLEHPRRLDFAELELSGSRQKIVEYSSAFRAD